MDFDRYPMLLLEELKTLIHAVVFVSSSSPTLVPLTDDSPYVNNLLYSLEKILSHGLKKEVTSMWKFVRNLDCCLPGTKSIISSIHRSHRTMHFAASPAIRGLARGRLFIRISLNEAGMGDYLSSMVYHPRILSDHYDRFALLRNEEHVSILLLLLDTLKCVTFALSTDSERLGLADQHYWYKQRRSNLVLSDETVATYRNHNFVLNPSETASSSSSSTSSSHMPATSAPSLIETTDLLPSRGSSTPKRNLSTSEDEEDDMPLDALQLVSSRARTSVGVRGGISKTPLAASVSAPRLNPNPPPTSSSSSSSTFFSFFKKSSSGNSNSTIQSLSSQAVESASPSSSISNGTSLLIDKDGTEDKESMNSFIQKVKEAARKGIPEKIRAQCWMSLAKMTTTAPTLSEYKQLLAKEINFGHKILQDLDRTFKSAANFDSEKRNKMFNVLKAFCIAHPELGYVQGMSYLTAVLIQVSMDEVEVFTLLRHLINKFPVFSDDMVGLRKCMYQMDRLVEQVIPRLFSHFKEQGITPLLFASEWFSTLFAYRVPISSCCKLWDIIMVEDPYYIFKLALAILQLTEDQLKKFKFEAIIMFLKDEVSHIKVENIIEEADSIPLTPEDVAKLEQEFLNPKTDQFSCFAIEV